MVAKVENVIEEHLFIVRFSNLLYILLLIQLLSTYCALYKTFVLVNMQVT